MSLAKFVAQRNIINTFWDKSAKQLNPKALTADDKLELAKALVVALEPESLTCDGEVRGAKLRAKAAMLNKAKAELEAMGQVVNYDLLGA